MHYHETLPNHFEIWGLTVVCRRIHEEMRNDCSSQNNVAIQNIFDINLVITLLQRGLDFVPPINIEKKRFLTWMGFFQIVIGPAVT